MPDKLTSHIANRLKQLRVQQGLTQAALAQKAGTNTNYYAKLERGEATPSLKMLQKVVNALGVRSTDVLPF
jgi:transcriptional regulator with XRE-family HTH domain